MSQVFVVEKDKSRYALKTPKAGAPDEFIKRFVREVRIMNQIDNDHVLKIIECNTTAVEPYYIMPLCESTLDNEIPRMNHTERLQVCKEFTIGINAIHSMGIRHRDIKPANALILQNHLKISDFGLGRMVDRDTTTMTGTTDVLGTFGYMPPEYYNNPHTFRDGTIEGDIYMLGKSIYVICSGGSNPVYVDSTMVDPSIYAVIDKCIKLNPIDRYHKVSDVLNDLTEIIRQQQFLAKQLLPIDEILEKRKLIEFENQVYNLLFSIGNDNTEMDKVLRKLSTDDLYRVFRFNKTTLPDFIEYFVESIEHAKTYIQFTEIDQYARIGQILIEVCDDIKSKQKVLQFIIDFAIGYNRYYAMEKIGEILAKMSDLDVNALSAFLKENQENLIAIKSCFKVSHHGYVKEILEGRG